MGQANSCAWESPGVADLVLAWIAGVHPICKRAAATSYININSETERLAAEFWATLRVPRKQSNAIKTIHTHSKSNKTIKRSQILSRRLSKAVKCIQKHPTTGQKLPKAINGNQKLSNAYKQQSKAIKSNQKHWENNQAKQLVFECVSFVMRVFV